MEKGEEITITRRGVAVALLVPARNGAAGDRRRAIQELKKFGRRLPARMTVRDLIQEGRRY